MSAHHVSARLLPERVERQGGWALDLHELTLIAKRANAQQRRGVLAARSAVLLTASPLGTALGGPLTTALGPRATLGGSGLATVALGAVAFVLLPARAREPVSA